MVTIPALIFWIFFGGVIASPQAYGAVAVLITVLMIVEGITYFLAGIKTGSPHAIFFGIGVGIIGYCCVGGYINTTAERNDTKEKIAASPNKKYIRDAIVLATKKHVDITEPTKFKFLDNNEILDLDGFGSGYGSEQFVFAEAPYRPGELIEFDKVLDKDGHVKHYGRIQDVKMTITEIVPPVSGSTLYYYYSVDVYDRKREYPSSDGNIVKVGDKAILKNGKDVFKLENGQEIPVHLSGYYVK